jgi:hypothetical protein
VPKGEETAMSAKIDVRFTADELGLPNEDGRHVAAREISNIVEGVLGKNADTLRRKFVGKTGESLETAVEDMVEAICQDISTQIERKGYEEEYGALHWDSREPWEKSVVATVRAASGVPVEEAKNPCWKGYRQLGMKKKGGKEVPNCVPVKEATEQEWKRWTKGWTVRMPSVPDFGLRHFDSEEAAFRYVETKMGGSDAVISFDGVPVKAKGVLGGWRTLLPSHHPLLQGKMNESHESHLIRVQHVESDGKVVSTISSDAFRKMALNIPGVSRTDFLETMVSKFNAWLRSRGRTDSARVAVRGMDF